ncbi:Uncharacterised protein [Mycobacteroides abscessus subsp. abscessus]|nr:Uncharacterised protein [Mycobacteroides abscessus subsp. abscessus]
MEVIGHSVVVNLGDRPLLGSEHTGEVAEVIDCQRDIGVQTFPDRLAVIPGFGDREPLDVLFHPVGDPQQGVRPFSGRGVTPRVGCGVCRVQRLLDIRRGTAGNLGEHLAVDRRGVLEVLAIRRGNPFPADEVLVPGRESDCTALGSGCRVLRHCLLLSISIPAL